MKSTHKMIGLVLVLALMLACGINIDMDDDTGSTQVPPSNPPTNPPSPPTEKPISPTSYFTYEVDYSSPIKVNGGGGTGGSQALEVSCPQGYLATGLIGASGIYIDSIGLQCSRLESNGTAGNVSNAKARGGTGGNEFSLPCPTNQFLVTVMGRSGIYVDQLTAYCESIDEAHSFESRSTGGDGGSPFMAKCPPGYAVTGVYGRSGNWMDSLNIICNRVKKVQH